MCGGFEEQSMLHEPMTTCCDVLLATSYVDARWSTLLVVDLLFRSYNFLLVMEERSAAISQLREMQARLQRADAAINGRREDVSQQQNGGLMSATTAPLRPQRPVLTIFTLFFEQDPVMQLTFPCLVEPLWGRLYSKRRTAGQSFSPEALYQEILSGVSVTSTPWVVISSTHTTEPLVVHAEEVRVVMSDIAITQPHCVVDVNGFSVEGRDFWKDWEYQMVLLQRASLKQNFADKETFSAARKGTWGAGSASHAFPGELLRPLKR